MEDGNGVYYSCPHGCALTMKDIPASRLAISIYRDGIQTPNVNQLGHQLS